MKTSIYTGEVSPPPAQAAGWGLRISVKDGEGSRKQGFGVEESLAKPGDGRIIAETIRKSRFDTMNNKSNGKSRMKTRVVITIVVLYSLLAELVMGQASFRFANYGNGIDAPIFDAAGSPLAGTNYAAELWGGATSNSLPPAFDISVFPPWREFASFYTGSGAGYFFLDAEMVVQDIPAGGFAWVQVRAWDARFGATYEDVAALGLGGYGESANRPRIH